MVWYWEEFSHFVSNFPYIFTTTDNQWNLKQCSTLICLEMRTTNLVKSFLFSGFMKRFAHCIPLSIFWSTLFIWTLSEIPPCLPANHILLLISWSLRVSVLIAWFWLVYFATVTSNFQPILKNMLWSYHTK